MEDSLRLGVGPGLDDAEGDASEVDPHPDLPDDFDEIDSDREGIESIPDPRHRDPMPDPDEPAPA